jgi:hypothetical protein
MADRKLVPCAITSTYRDPKTKVTYAPLYEQGKPQPVMVPPYIRERHRQVTRQRQRTRNQTLLAPPVTQRATPEDLAADEDAAGAASEPPAPAPAPGDESAAGDSTSPEPAAQAPSAEASAEGEEEPRVQRADTGFPEDFPAIMTLKSAGIDSLQALVSAYPDGGYTDIDGVGAVTARRIADAIDDMSL